MSWRLPLPGGAPGGGGGGAGGAPKAPTPGPDGSEVSGDTTSTTTASGTAQMGRPEVFLKPLSRSVFRMYGITGSVAAAITFPLAASSRADRLLSRK